MNEREPTSQERAKYEPKFWVTWTTPKQQHMPACKSYYAGSTYMSAPWVGESQKWNSAATFTAEQGRQIIARFEDEWRTKHSIPLGSSYALEPYHEPKKEELVEIESLDGYSIDRENESASIMNGQCNIVLRPTTLERMTDGKDFLGPLYVKAINRKNESLTCVKDKYFAAVYSRWFASDMIDQIKKVLAKRATKPQQEAESSEAEQEQIKSIINACIDEHDAKQSMVPNLDAARGMVNAVVERLESEVKSKNETIKKLEDELVNIKSKDTGLLMLIMTLQKCTAIFSEYAIHHFEKEADDKAAANRAHAKMCRDALAKLDGDK